MGAMLMVNLDNKFKVFTNIPSELSVLALTLSLLATAILGVYLINRFYKPDIPVKGNFSINRPSDEKLTQGFFIMRIITNIALAVLNPYNPFFVFNAALEIFSLVKVTQRKWIEYKKNFKIDLQVNGKLAANEMGITYHFLIQNIKVLGLAKDEEDDCTICMEKNKKKPKDVYSCPEHTTHSDCLLDTLKGKSENFHIGLKVEQRLETKPDHHSRGVHTNTTYDVTYLLKVPKTTLPSCPFCRDISDHNRFTVGFYDLKREQWARGAITWI